MFDFGSGELVVIGVVALVAIGPKELPGLLRTVGQAVGKLRRMAGDFQNQFNEAMREADMADAQKMISDIKTDFSSTMTGAGAMSPPIVMPTSDNVSDTVSPEAPHIEVGALSDDNIGVSPVAEAEPVSVELVASPEVHKETVAVHGDTNASTETTPKTQAGAA